MPEEELDSLEKLRGFPLWVKSIVGAIVAAAIGYNTYKTVMMDLFPDQFASEVDKEVIHQDVEKLKEEVKAELLILIEDELNKSKGAHSWLKGEISKVDDKIETVIEIQDANKLHREFNTQAITIVCDAVKEEMDKKENDCGWAYYETNGGDNWNTFDGQYKSRLLYSVDLRSDCRAFYTPIGGSKTRAN